jgi:hypothetical protein
MEYNSLFEPLLCIFLSMCLGFAIGTITILIQASKEQKALSEELDKFRALYFAEIDKWKNKYTNDDEE